MVLCPQSLHSASQRLDCSMACGGGGRSGGVYVLYTDLESHTVWPLFSSLSALTPPDLSTGFSNRLKSPAT